MVMWYNSSRSHTRNTVYFLGLRSYAISRIVKCGVTFHLGRNDSLILHIADLARQTLWNSFRSNYNVLLYLSIHYHELARFLHIMWRKVLPRIGWLKFQFESLSAHKMPYYSFRYIVYIPSFGLPIIDQSIKYNLNFSTLLKIFPDTIL